MSNRQEPPDSTPWTHPNQRFTNIADYLTGENPAFPGELAQAITPNTRYDEACDRIVSEALLAISFGLIARARPIDLPLFQNAGSLYAMRASGHTIRPEAWESVKLAVGARLQDVDANHEGWDVPAHVYTALTALQIAVGTDPAAHFAAWNVLRLAVHAWDEEIQAQHAAAVFWACDITLHHIRKASEEIPNATAEEEADTIPNARAGDA